MTPGESALWNLFQSETNLGKTFDKEQMQEKVDQATTDRKELEWAFIVSVCG